MLLEILTLIQEWPAVHYHQVEVICRGLSSNRKLRQRKFHEHVAYTQCTCSCLTVTSVPPLISWEFPYDWLRRKIASLDNRGYVEGDYCSIIAPLVCDLEIKVKESFQRERTSGGMFCGLFFLEEASLFPERIFLVEMPGKRYNFIHEWWLIIW